MSILSLIERLPDPLISGSPLLQHIAPADRHRVSAASQVMLCDAGEMIYRQGEASQALAVLMDGEVRLSVPSLHGRELCINVIRYGQSFGEIGFFDGKPRSVDATAVRRSRVLLIGRAALLEVMDHTPALATAFAAAICQRLRRTTEAVQQAVFYTLEPRLADCLLRLAATNALSGTSGVSEIKVWQHDLAAMVGVTRESINKQLRRWEASGILSIGRGRIAILNARELEAVLGDMSS